MFETAIKNARRRFLTVSLKWAQRYRKMRQTNAHLVLEGCFRCRVNERLRSLWGKNNSGPVLIVVQMLSFANTIKGTVKLFQKKSASLKQYYSIAKPNYKLYLKKKKKTFDLLCSYVHDSRYVLRIIVHVLLPNKIAEKG